MKKLVFLFIIGLIGTLNASDITPVTKILKIYTYGDGAVIKVANPAENTEGCSYDRSGEFLALRLDTEGKKAMYSSLLSALVASRDVVIAASDCDDIWGEDNTMGSIYRVQIRN
jgi:hypothetical protein